ncbi:MAG: Rieske (2Fe-2S) protein [Anaerolineales bacterium]|nr:Rieske (2Fe-2S) protein [Anaerolineales bacterium]MCX7755471.1 Rieske (2Fe-2S) protein [Anaerolineales bacterium]MDW8278279.1 Rieske (2Fe-2S) protein [Anaerolineales bacterium]
MTKINIGRINDFEIGKPRVVRAGGATIVVNRTENGFCAVANHCPHLGLPIAGGKIEGNVITCPFHGSRFDMCTGENLDWVTSFAGAKLPEWSRRLVAMGKKPTPIETFAVTLENENVFVTIPTA